MKMRREQKEDVVFTLIRDFLSRDNDTTVNEEPISEQVFHRLLALAAVIVGLFWRDALGVRE